MAANSYGSSDQVPLGIPCAEFQALRYSGRTSGTITKCLRSVFVVPVNWSDVVHTALVLTPATFFLKKSEVTACTAVDVQVY